MREHARRDADELVPRPPFEVFGMAEPELRPLALLERSGQDIRLGHGVWVAWTGWTWRRR